MKSEDLRIGNLVEYNGKVISVLAVGSDDVVMASENDLGYTIEYLKPIPLTEEWLLRFGFDKSGNDLMPRSIRYEIDWIAIFPSNDFCDFKGFGFIWYKPDKESTTESARVKIQYVNQLQNLYFALTGTELRAELDTYKTK